MQRGELYLVRKPGSRDPKKQRVSKFSTIICAPVYSRHDGLSTQVRLGPEHGLKHESSIHCDELVSLPKEMLTHYVARLNGTSMRQLDSALAIALDLSEAQ